MLIASHRVFALALLVVGSLASEGSTCPGASHIAIGSGSFSSRPGVTFALRHFVATLEPMGKTAPSCFQKMTVLSRGEIFVTNASLTNVFAEKLGGPDSKIKDLKIENGLQKVSLTGKIKKVVPVEFSIEGPVTTDGTSLFVDANKIRADGIPIKALLAVVGEHLSSVLSLNGVSGVSVVGNRIAFAPEQIAHLKGHIDSVETTPAGLILRYTNPGAKKRSQ